jgi:D-alanyl-D-alanine carboxypeptidase (penicillin-binding protein 5/6)
MALNSAFRTLSVVFVLMLALTGKAMSQSVLIPSPPQIAGSSYVLMDPGSGRILMEENSHERLPPASLTKMMTAYIVERELDEGRIAMSDMVPISVNAWKTEGSRTFVREGTQVSVEDLLRGVIIQSGNDASVALAEFVAGSEDAFVDIMNQQARLLGMNIVQQPMIWPYWPGRSSMITRKTILSTPKSTSPTTIFANRTGTVCSGVTTASMA